MRVTSAFWLALATICLTYVNALALPRSLTSVDDLTVALVRTGPALWAEPILSREYHGVDINATADKGVALIKLVANKGADLVAFPETWFPGYPRGNDDAWIVKWVANYIENSMTVGDANWKKIIAAAKKNNVFVAFGFSEKTSNAAAIWRRTIGLLECWEHFHPSMTFSMEAQLEAIHIGSWPYTPNPNNSQALFWESEEVNMAAARLYAVNSGAWTLVPLVGRAAIFSPTRLEVAHIDADVSLTAEPLLYYSIDTTAFTGTPYNINGEQSWGVLQQITEGWPKVVPKVIGN